MSKLCLVVAITFYSFGVLAGEEYCYQMKSAKSAGYDEMNRLGKAAAQQRDPSRIGWFITKLRMVQIVNLNINTACPELEDSLPTRASQNYCREMEIAKKFGFEELNRLTDLAAQVTDLSELKKYTKKIKAVEGVNLAIAKACPGPK